MSRVEFVLGVAGTVAALVALAGFGLVLWRTWREAGE